MTGGRSRRTWDDHDCRDKWNNWRHHNLVICPRLGNHTGSLAIGTPCLPMQITELSVKTMWVATFKNNSINCWNEQKAQQDSWQQNQNKKPVKTVGNKDMNMKMGHWHPQCDRSLTPTKTWQSHSRSGDWTVEDPTANKRISACQWCG